MTRKALASYDIRGTRAEQVRDTLDGLDRVIYELVAVFEHDPDDVLNRCDISVAEADQERRDNAESTR